MVMGQDIIIMNVIGSFNDLGKELNMCVMKVQEWYG
jgi:RNA processing factor Prp31